jgi:hypothetical protein
MLSESKAAVHHIASYFIIELQPGPTVAQDSQKRRAHSSNCSTFLYVHVFDEQTQSNRNIQTERAPASHRMLASPGSNYDKII